MSTEQDLGEAVTDSGPNAGQVVRKVVIQPDPVLTDRQRHIEHDLWHVDLSVWLGIPSYALWGATGFKLTPDMQAIADLEEQAVLALQRLAAVHHVGLPRGDA